jgi:hypothetical protein
MSYWGRIENRRTTGIIAGLCQGAAIVAEMIDQASDRDCNVIAKRLAVILPFVFYVASWGVPL